MKEARFDSVSDAELLQRYQQDRDTEWMGVLLQRYTLLLFGVCMKYLKDEDAAKDAVQQLFLKVLTEVERHPITYFKSWLYTVAKNYCLMQLRDASGKKMQALTENLTTLHEDLKKGDWQENEATYIYLEEALQALPPEQRECVVLFYLQKKSYQQISVQTGFSLLQVKSYIQNGKRNLKNVIQKKQKHPGAKR